MEEEKKVIYAIIAACIIGIFIVGFLVVTYIPMKEGFSELYFEEHEELPKGITVGEEEQFAFTVASHELNTASYKYVVSLDEEILEEGSFTLDPDENITVNVPFTPTNSSLTLVRNLTTTESKHISFSRPFIITSGNMSAEPNGRVLIPVKFPVAGSEDSIITWNLDPNSEESYSFESKRTEPVGNILNLLMSDETILAETRLSGIGINLITYNTTLHSIRGDIQITNEKTISEYRYAFKKMSVQVASEDGTEYEIHFWTIVVLSQLTRFFSHLHS